MSVLKLTSDLAEAASVGGCVLGGGGGGSMKEGICMAKMATEFASLELWDGEDLPEDAVLINVSAVGAPSAETAFFTPADYGKAVSNLGKFADIKIAGIISNEAGGLATVNGWLQSALLGVPVVDLPSNGRAHPTGVMGAMGLHKVEGYQSIQSAVGGDPACGRRVEVVVQGSIQNASAQVRNAAVLAGGFVGVARNPVTVGYAKKHAAGGAIKQAIRLGQGMIAKREQGGPAVMEEICRQLNGAIVHQGKVEKVDLVCKGGFDAGAVYWDGFELTFWNEYMTAEKDGVRLGTFPDLIMTLDAQTGWPVTSAEIRAGMEIAVLHVGREHLHLGAGMWDPDLYRGCEDAVGKEIIRCVFE